MRGPSPLYIEERHRALGRDATFSWSRALTHPPRCNRTRHRGRHLDFVGAAILVSWGPPSWIGSRGGRHLGPKVVGAAILDRKWRHWRYSGAYTTFISRFPTNELRVATIAQKRLRIDYDSVTMSKNALGIWYESRTIFRIGEFVAKVLNSSKLLSRIPDRPTNCKNWLRTVRIG